MEDLVNNLFKSRNSTGSESGSLANLFNQVSRLDTHNTNIKSSIAVNSSILNSANLSTQTSIFTLRDVDPHDIATQYHEGIFKDTIIPRHNIGSKIQDSSEILMEAGNLNDGRDEVIYRQREGGQNNTFVSIGYPDYIQAKKDITNGQKTQLSKDYPCIWCRKNLQTLSEGINPVPIPKKVEIKDDVYIFTSLPMKFCCFGCGYSYLQHLGSLKHISIRINDIIPIFRLLFNEIHPGKDLVPSPDWIMHKRNGGILNDTEYYGTRYHYYPTGNLVLHPAKTEYAMVDRKIN